MKMSFLSKQAFLKLDSNVNKKIEREAKKENDGMKNAVIFLGKTERRCSLKNNLRAMIENQMIFTKSS